jgi:hypothetical protein
MKRISIILIVVFIFFMIAVLAFSPLVIATNEESKDLSKLKDSSLDGFKIEQDKLLQLRESTIKQRNELINQIMNFVTNPNSRHNTPAYFTAVGILGDIRAVEVTDKLLDIVVDQYDPFMFSLLPRGVSSDKFDLLGFTAVTFPPIGSIIKLHPSYQSLLKRLKNEDELTKNNLYSTILMGTEGTEISQYLLEKAIKDETEARKIDNLKYALKFIKESNPINQGDIK